MKVTMDWCGLATRSVLLIGIGSLPVVASGQDFRRTDVTEYHDDLSLWVIGQEKRRYNAETVIVESQVEYHPGTALPWKVYELGKLKHTLTYHADGTLATVTDGRGNTTHLSGWERGIPELIRHADGTTESADVKDGRVAWVTDEAGAKTCYGYDVMGRLTRTTFPSESQLGICDASTWTEATQSFTQTTAANHGLEAGHWVIARRLGNRHVNTYLDGLWRPVLEEQLDVADVNGTLSQVVKRYDHEGRVVFESYPKRWVDRVNENQGTHTTYDGIGRVVRVEQDSEHGRLKTVNEFLPGLQLRVTNPRGYQTTTAFFAWDSPRYDTPIWSAMPEGAVIEISRNIFGRPLSLKRRKADGTLGVTRHYVYDGHMQLCKTIEPETGASVIGYDANGNVEWSASGLALPAADNCDHVPASNSGRVVWRGYDPRDRLKHLRLPDRNGDQDWTYHPDGRVKDITTYNDGGATSYVNTYTYNRRGLLTGEGANMTGWYAWGIGYGYDALGHLSTQTQTQTGAVTYFAPNALGQPTQVVSNVGTFATGVSYYPNGAIQQFTYGNGLVHSMQQNARQLPQRVTASGGAMDYDYAYDLNGNVERVYDFAPSSTPKHRWMGYDGLDRLTAVGSAIFGGDHWHRFTYDALDNLRSWTLAGVKDYADYYYNPANNRLEGIRNSAGATVVGLTYDAQGNLRNKNGREYYFDFGNRLRGVSGRESYRYDGHGRRVLAWRPEEARGGDVHGLTLSVYSNAGQILFEHTDKEWTEHYYLAGSLIGDRTYKFGTTGAVELKYFHTDALGSPVATTNSSGQVIDRTDWEPYGAAIGKPTYQGIGYTGHVMDGATGLTYMQQRYYDPNIGRFLSVDPIAADPNSGSMFNRFNYANNNPYRFVDPDGRRGREAQLKPRPNRPDTRSARPRTQQGTQRQRSGAQSGTPGRVATESVEGGMGSYGPLLTPICHVSMSGCSAQSVYDYGLRVAPGPAGDGRRVENGAVSQLFVGPTQHFFDDANLTVRNVALEGHVLSGVVTRQVVMDGSGWVYIQTVKTGPATAMNVVARLFDGGVWRAVDQEIQANVYNNTRRQK